MTRKLDQGYENAYGPSPPPEISAALGVPILTNAEYDNSRQFLDFFTTSELGNADFLDAFSNIPHGALPNFHGLSSTFGRPDTVQYEHSLFTDSFFAPSSSVRSHALHDNSLSFLNPDLTDKHRSIGNDSNKVLDTKQFNASPELALLNENQVSIGSLNRVDGYHNAQEVILGFGSDSSFANQHYAPPPGMEGIEDVEGRVLRTLKGLETVNSAASTQPSSPVTSKTKRTTTEAELAVPSGSVSRNKKRRKPEISTNKLEDSAPEELDTKPNPRKTTKSRNNVPLADSPQPIRRKSRGNEAKKANLTEQEKRENHIRSEQKRRNQIREGFANLLALMPESMSEGSASSKCLIFSRAVEWMTGLSEGNKELRAQLEVLGNSDS